MVSAHTDQEKAHARGHSQTSRRGFVNSRLRVRFLSSAPPGHFDGYTSVIEAPALGTLPVPLPATRLLPKLATELPTSAMPVALFTMMEFDRRTVGVPSFAPSPTPL